MAEHPEQMGGEPVHTTGDPLVTFLYLLLRDHVAPGLVEQVVLTALAHPEHDLTNRYLGLYAENIADRLR